MSFNVNRNFPDRLLEAGVHGYVPKSLGIAEVTAALKDRGALVTRTDIMGVYKIPGFGKDINPDDIVISCAKDGYTEANVVRRPRDNGAFRCPHMSRIA